MIKDGVYSECLWNDYCLAICSDLICCKNNIQVKLSLKNYVRYQKIKNTHKPGNGSSTPGKRKDFYDLMLCMSLTRYFIEGISD